MDSNELWAALKELEFTEGYAIRDGFIVSWENKKQIPKELAKFVKLDVAE